MFNVSNTRIDGLQDKCRDCAKIYRKTQDKKEWADYMKNWVKNNKEKNRKIRKKSRQKYRQKFPKKHRADQIVYHAIKKGLIIKDVCKICGEKNVQGHHEDYDRPLDVIWLCDKHHKRLHELYIKAGCD